MSATEPPADELPALAEPVLARQNRLRLSLVWIVPIVALIVGAVLVARSFLQTGPEITIEFRSAEGLEPGRTEVRFKEVTVGRVRRVTLGPDRSKVIVTVRLDKSVESLAVEDTRFWVVRPRIGSAGISGLSTLLSGAYIAVDAGASEESASEFVGLDAPPLLLRGEPGRSFVLRADDLGSLDVGSPVYFRHIRAGRVVGYTLDPGGRALTVQVFIESPNERFVTRQTRFWNASGVEFTVGSSGLTVNTESLASLLAGGIVFGSPEGSAGAQQAPPGETFRLYANEHAALAPEDGEPLRVRMVFDQSLRGLEPGAAVDLQGFEIGTVRGIEMLHDASKHRLPMAVTADIYPMRLGKLRERFEPPRGAGAPRDALLLAQLVDEGLRAQVRNGSLITGKLYVALDFAPKAPRAHLDPGAAVLTLPTMPGGFDDMQAQLAQTLDKLSRVQFDEIGSELQGTLKSASTTIQALQSTLAGADDTMHKLTPDAQRALLELRRTLESVQRGLGSAERNLVDADGPLQRQAGQTLAELQRAAQALRLLGDYLQRHPESLLRGKPDDVVPARPPEPNK